MRRDYFTLKVENVDWVETDGDPRKPTVTIDFEGPAASLKTHLQGTDGSFLRADETDVSFRVQDDSVESPDATGVVSVTNRLTGDYILELDESAANVRKFIEAARTYEQSTTDSAGRYLVYIRIDGEDLVTYDKSTFLVYDGDGSLDRQYSLIPGGVEL